MKIKTNNVPRPLLYWHELTKEERKDFRENKDGSFIRYKGVLYDLSNFTGCPCGGELNKMGWSAYFADSFFSGVVIKWVNQDAVIVGTAIL